MMSTGPGYRTSTRSVRASSPSTRIPQHALPYVVLLAMALATTARPGAAFGQSCIGPCLLDRPLVTVTAAAGDQKSPNARPADRGGASLSRKRPDPASSRSTPRWTVSAEAIGLGRVGGVDRTLVSRVPGTEQFLATSHVPGVEALNSNQLNGFSAGPRISVIYHGDSGYGAELTYFNVFDQGATRAIGPDNPADWLVMKAPGVFWQTQDFPYQAMVWRSTTSLYGAEANGRLDLSGRVTMLAGVRWFQLNDNLSGDLTPADQTAPTWKTPCSNPLNVNCTLFDITAGSTAAGNYPPFWVASTTNNLYGFQVGADAKLLEYGRFSLGGQIKAGLFENRAEQRAGVSMAKVVYLSQAATDHAAFVGELGLQLKYLVAGGLAVKVGYKALWFAGVALAPGQIQETFSSMRGVTALGVDCGSQALFQGATVGLEYSF